MPDEHCGGNYKKLEPYVGRAHYYYYRDCYGSEITTGTNLNTMPEMHSTQDESLDDEARRLAKD